MIDTIMTLTTTIREYSQYIIILQSILKKHSILALKT